MNIHNLLIAAASILLVEVVIVLGVILASVIYLGGI